MTERILSELQKEYRNFFLGKLKLYGVHSPAELKTKENKSIFFTEIKQDWTKVKLAKKQKKEAEKIKIQTTEKEISAFKKISTETISQNPKKPIYQDTESKSHTKRKEFQQPTQQECSKQIIKSVPNKEQTEDLKILFTPNIHFEQPEQYLYPVVKMPKQNSLLKLPRNDRSNQKGYKEDEFFALLQSRITNFELSNNFHLTIPFLTKPYEPDIVIFDKKKNLYLDIEIDEPYDGFYRFPTHNYKAEDGFKQDNIRDLFFTESGWVVIRFTEKQIHISPNECIEFIENVLNSIYDREFNKQPKCVKEEQWNENECTQWQLNRYRESYLGIHSFFKRNSLKEVYVDNISLDSIENTIQRTPFEDIAKEYDKDLHKYFHKNDKSGNAEFISVTTLIERFFQFDILRYIQRESEKLGTDEKAFFLKFQADRDEAAQLGTDLHKSIEIYLTQNLYDENSKDNLEFNYFIKFIKDKIEPKKLIFVEAEKEIFYNHFNIAGTVDCLFKNKDETYVMVDWKRSKKLIVEGTNQPDKRGFQIEIIGLSNLTNSSYYRYCIQQNIYKIILEKEYNINIGEMVLVVLHEKYPSFHTIKLPEMKQESEIIINSINHKI